MAYDEVDDQIRKTETVKYGDRVVVTGVCYRGKIGHVSPAWGAAGVVRVVFEGGQIGVPRCAEFQKKHLRRLAD